MTKSLVPSSILQAHEEDDATKTSSHLHTLSVPMSNYEVAELTWENGQPVMHGLSGLLHAAQTKPTWSRAHETLESIVQQAACQYQKSNFTMPQDQTITNISSTVPPSGGTTPDEESGQAQMVPMITRKRERSDSGYCSRNWSSNTNNIEECDPSYGGSATYCRDDDTTMMTWASLESGRSLKSGKTVEDDSPSHCESENQDQEEEDRDTKPETGRSNSTRRNRAAAIHNQSERRRRDRINQKMKALQRLVPNASKTDKASILDEVIEYLKQLQAQIQMMSMRTTPQQMTMMMPLAMQQQLQMSMLARMGVGMGLGMGMGMLNTNTTMAPRTPAPPSLPLPQLTVGAPAIAPSFIMPPLIQAYAPPKPEPASAPTTSASVSLADPYATILSQPVNMDILNSMTALYQQQIRQNNQAVNSNKGTEKKSEMKMEYTCENGNSSMMRKTNNCIYTQQQF